MSAYSELPARLRVEAFVRRRLTGPGTGGKVGLVRRKTAKLVLRKHAVAALKASYGAGANTYMYDAVDTSVLPRNTAQSTAYAGYVNGIYQTWGTIVSLFEAAGHPLLSISINATGKARCIDQETGDATVGQVYGWWKNFAEKTETPVHYCAASGLAQAQSTNKANGLVQGKDILNWSAHYTGTPHFCAPNVCGYGIAAANATQYSTGSVDTSIVAPGFFAAAPAPAPTPPPAPTPQPEDDMQIPPGTSSPSVGLSFPGAGTYSTMGLCADPSFEGATQTQIRVAFHLVGGGWSVVTPVTVTDGSGAKTVVPVPAHADGVSVKRLDNVNVTLYPNFS